MPSRERQISMYLATWGKQRCTCGHLRAAHAGAAEMGRGLNCTEFACKCPRFELRRAHDFDERIE